MVAVAELFWGDTGVFAKLEGESTLIAEAELHGDLNDRRVSAGQGFTGSLDAGAGDELVGCHAKRFMELPVQLAFG